MSNRTQEILEEYGRVVMPTYAPSVAVASGRGATVRDADGLTLYDFTAGIGVQNAGHCHPKVVEAICEQAKQLTHCSNLFANEPATKLAAKLVELSGLGGKVFFANSGAEANEAAIKLARRWGAANGGRYEVITFRQGFHGRTLATLAATGQAWCQEGYDPLPVGFAYADYNDIESVRAQVNDKTVAVMLEAVQGEGGVTPATPEFMSAVRARHTIPAPGAVSSSSQSPTWISGAPSPRVRALWPFRSSRVRLWLSGRNWIFRFRLCPSKRINPIPPL